MLTLMIFSGSACADIELISKSADVAIEAILFTRMTLVLFVHVRWVCSLSES
ncbi:hypothetical protein [Vibrio vulnificus YJ016]|uniref:Uncharacterized protein n=1 Tax=Vibrio vulnificus (strain YJ016) TaxID=196600 RepID=Q7ML47_VIBVY|nr:hypothetical protein [Vibrio vulnificus YJ016]